VGPGSGRPRSPDPLLTGANQRCFENSLRSSAASDFFSPLRYYSQTPFEFRAATGLRYCKFGCCRRTEAGNGIPQPMTTHAMVSGGAAGETLSPKLLRKEFRKRVWSRVSLPTYHLEMQLRAERGRPSRGCSLEPLRMGGGEHPWRLWRRFTSTRSTKPNPYGARRLRNHPRPRLHSLIEPLSIYDPPSLEYCAFGGAFARRRAAARTILCSARLSPSPIFVPRLVPGKSESSVGRRRLDGRAAASERDRGSTSDAGGAIGARERL